MKSPALRARLLSAFLLVLSAPAAAQIDEQMNRLFGSMSNVSDPGMVQGQTRGVITGGSVQMRSGVMSTQLAGLTMPSTSAGCGGLDAYGGSFSFINKEEFTNFGKKVAANAAGYAFHLALSAMCDTCDAQMQALQKKVEEWNQYFQNSCETAERLVDASGYTAAMERMAATYRTSSGAGDNVESANQGPGNESASAAVAHENPEVARRLIPGNILMKSLRDIGAVSWFEGGSGADVLQDIMSLTGTVVVCVPGHEGCTSRDGGVSSRSNEPTAFTLSATLSFHDLVFGNTNGVKVWRCNDQACTAPRLETLASFKSMNQRVLELVNGPAGTTEGAAGGLIGKISHNVGPLTAQEQGFMTGAGLYSGMVIALARRSESGARQFATAYAPEISAEIISDFIDRIIMWSSLAVNVNGQDATGMLGDLLERARQDAREGRREISQSLAGQGQILAHFQGLMNMLPPPELPTRAQTISGSE